jgi:hypothetical protein
MKTHFFILITGCCFAVNAQEKEHLKGASHEVNQNTLHRISNTVQSSVLEVRVFPNPSHGELSIEGKTGSMVTVYTTSGIYVGTWTIDVEEKLSLSELPSGSYVCAVSMDGLRCVKRFVVL